MTSQPQSSIFQRILERLHKSREDICIDGSSDYQRGFFEGYDLARRVVEVERGNRACQGAAARSRQIEESQND